MNTIQRIAKNTLVFAVAQVVSYLLDFFFIMFIARYLGAEAFGILSFALAFTAIFIVLSDLGLQQLTTREVARDKSLTPKYLGNITIIKLILVVITFGLITLTINLLGYPQQTITVVYLVGLSLIFNAFTQMFNSIFQAYERIEFMSLGQVLRAILLLGGALLGISQGFSVFGFALLYPIVNILVLGYSFAVSIKKFVLPKIEIDFSFWKSSLREALPFGLTAIFVTIYFYIDTVMLSLMKGDTVVGWYNAAYRSVYVLLFIPGAYFASIYPVMSRFFVSSAKSLRLIYERSSRLIFMLALPIATGITLLAGRIILLIFGAEYASSIIALQILIWAVFFSFITNTPLWTLNSINKQRIVTGIAFLGMVLNIILNLILIPGLSYIGASIATVATEFLCFTLLFYYAARLFGNPLSLNFIAKTILSSSIMALYVIYCGKLMNIGLVIFTAAVIYMLLLLLLRAFSKEDVSMIRRLISKPSGQMTSPTEPDGENQPK
jgi:O-antigen/teichoic acid export membrane protein